MIRTRDITLEQVRSLADNGTLFALLDSCDEPEIPARCNALAPDNAACLWQGQGLRDFWHIAPYLMRVSRTELDWICRDLWNKPWGCFVAGRSDVQSLRTHFRQFLTVPGADGQKMLFRFYDPRVIKPFLHARAEHEVEQFYGPAAGFGITAPFDLAKIEFITK